MTSEILLKRAFAAAARPLTPLTPLSHRTPARRERGGMKDKLEPVSLLSRKGGSAAGEEGRGGEGPGGAATIRFRRS